MAIALDATTNGGGNGGASTTLTFAHTCAGADRILFVDFISGSIDNVTGVTYAGVAMTSLGKRLSALSRNSLFMLVAPALGANNVVITCGTAQNIIGGATSYTGAKQTAQPDNVTTNDAGSPALTTLTTSLTPVAPNCWVALSETGYNFNDPPSAGAGATRRAYDTVNGAYGHFDSNAPVAGGASYSMTTTRTSPQTSGGEFIMHVMASFAPAAAAATPWVYLPVTQTLGVGPPPGEVV